MLIDLCKVFFCLGGFSRPLGMIMACPSRFHFKANPTLMAHSNHLIEIIYGQGRCAGLRDGSIGTHDLEFH
jgi:hypothetical protein